MASQFTVEVVYARTDQQKLISLNYRQPVTIKQAILDSDILQSFPEINLSAVQVGIFGKKYPLDKILNANDRVEIYRSLLQDPMEARRNRAIKQLK